MKPLCKTIAVAAAILAIFCSTAAAQEAYPTREIMRPLVLEYLMFEAGIGFSWLTTSDAFDDGGDLESMDADFTVMAGRLDLSFGIAENLQFGVGIPYVYRELDISDPFPDPATGLSLDGMQVEGFGNLEATMLLQMHREMIDRPTSVVIGVRGIFPILGESEIKDYGDFIMGAPSRGTYAVGPLIIVKETYSTGFGMIASFEWDFYLKGKQKMYGETVDTDYGDIYIVGLEPIFQVSDPIAIWVSMFYTMSYGSDFELDGVKIAEYDDSYLFEVRPAIELQLGEHFDIFVGTSYKAMGKNVPAGWPIWGRIEIRF